MNSTKKTKPYAVGIFTVATFLLLLYFLGEIIIPFILATFVAFILNPIIEKIQKKIKNRFLAVTSFLFLFCFLIFNVTFFLGDYIVKDTQRFVSSVGVFIDKNEKDINKVKNKVVSLLSEVSDSEAVKQKVETVKKDPEKTKKNIISALKQVQSLLQSPDNAVKPPTTSPWSILYILVYFIIYTVLILYSYDYFEEFFNKFFRSKKLQDNKYIKNFRLLFVDYFRQRTKVVIISSLIFIIAFEFINLPGALCIGLIAGLLTYASEFHYFSLPLTLVGCWVLSVEQNTHFLTFVAIIIGIYLFVSLLEETIFTNKIMKSTSGMNTAITILSFAIWTQVFGAFIGTVVALPLTQLLMVYGKSLMQDSDKG